MIFVKTSTRFTLPSIFNLLIVLTVVMARLGGSQFATLDTRFEA